MTSKHITYIGLIMLIFFFGCVKDDVRPLSKKIEGGKPFYFENRDEKTSRYDYVWDFGDGNTSTETNPTHTFVQAGNYIVNIARYKKGSFVSKEVFYVVEVEQVYSPSVNNVQIEIKYSDFLFKNIETQINFQLTDNQDEDDYTYKIEISDGAVLSERWSKYTFTSSGNHDLIFTITDKNGISGTFDTTVFIAPDYSTLNITVPDAQLTKLDTILERYVMVYDISSQFTSYRADGDIQDMKKYPGPAGGPLVNNDGELFSFVGFVGFVGYSYSYKAIDEDAISYQSLEPFSNGESLSVKTLSHEIDGTRVAEFPKLGIILVEVGTQGKSIGYTEIEITPGKEASLTMNLDFYPY